MRPLGTPRAENPVQSWPKPSSPYTHQANYVTTVPSGLPMTLQTQPKISRRTLRIRKIGFFGQSLLTGSQTVQTHSTSSLYERIKCARFRIICLDSLNPLVYFATTKNPSEKGILLADPYLAGVIHYHRITPVCKGESTPMAAEYSTEAKSGRYKFIANSMINRHCQVNSHLLTH